MERAAGSLLIIGGLALLIFSIPPVSPIAMLAFLFALLLVGLGVKEFRIARRIRD